MGDETHVEDATEETKWVVQWAEPMGETAAQRVVDTEEEADAVVEAMKQKYEPVEDEPGLYRIELNAEVYFTTKEIPYGPVPEGYVEAGVGGADEANELTD